VVAHTICKRPPFVVQSEIAKIFAQIFYRTVYTMTVAIPTDVEEEQLRLELRLKQLEVQEAAKGNFLSFARYVWPEAIFGAHHAKMASAFDRIANGTLKRLIINMPPRHTKSEFASYLLPAFMMGKDPRTKIIEATHTAELAVRFGRKVRDLMDSEPYKELFPNVLLKADSKAAGRWDTNAGGEYFACGVGGALTGRGAGLLVIDDPHSEQDAMSDLALDNAWDWYQGGPRTRLQPGGAIVIVMTRWGTRDLTARLIKSQTSHNADKWEVIEFPAILPSGKPLWPEFWKIEELEAVKASLSLQKWNAMYQQQPTNDEGAILKREWWKVWPSDEPPPVNYIIQSYDTAYSKKETADFSVITTWGVFHPNQDSGPNIILLAVNKGRWDFPELKRIAKEEYEYWKPDNVLIEAKATGTTLQQELRRVGIPVTMYSPGGRRSGQDKVSRANSVAPILESGMVWAPDTDWAEELVEECAAFPNGDHDDLVDSTTQALMRFRAGNFITLNSDYQEDGESSDSVVAEYY
jgi:predicted phage terminase large subunit-like protein